MDLIGPRCVVGSSERTRIHRLNYFDECRTWFWLPSFNMSFAHQLALSGDPSSLHAFATEIIERQR